MPAVETLNSHPGPTFADPGQGLLIDTMRLEEPRKQQKIPNHLLETKIYTQVTQNAMVQAKPAVIHFGGFEVEKKQTASLSIVNVSTEVIRMHIIPPQTKYFNIKYQKTERLVPGLTIDCTVEFFPDEWRYYYDCIRINCPGEENLLIPVHAYPVMSTKDFPQLFNFPPVPVGHKMTKLFPLRCDAPVDFEFQLTYLQPHPAFMISPMEGIIPANGEAEITVTFAPLEFHTACIRIQLVISQFNSKPIVCTITGTSPPGLLKEITENKYSTISEDTAILDPRSLTPLGRARKKKKLQIQKETTMPVVGVPQEIEYQGLKFPAQLDTPYAVAKVLAQEPGKLKAKYLREAVVTKDSKPKVATRQMKEAAFEHQVRQNVYEERQNQLRWQVKLGDMQISNEDRVKTLANRNEAWNIYRYQRCDDPIPENEYKRMCTSCTFRRTLRDMNQLASEGAQFDLYSNNMWAVRHSALDRFAQAARRVIIRQRAEFKLKSLRKVIVDWHKKRSYSETLTEEQKDEVDSDEKNEFIPADFELSSEKIALHQFVTYVPPNVKDDMAPDALGTVPFKPLEVVVKRKVPYFNLKVPQQYKLMEYRPQSVHNASSGYVPVKSLRPLRIGAEDEMITLPPPPVITDDRAEIAGRTSLAIDLGQEPETSIKETQSRQDNVPQSTTIVPPQALFQPIEYPPLHIFNPAPGLHVFQSPMPYAETDPDFHLCPLPRYTRKDHATNPHASTQRRYADREDVVRGIMAWKKFPSQGLTSLTNTPTLTNVWVPRWDNPFSSDMLPEEVPPLYDSLPEDDKENVLLDVEGTEEGIEATSGECAVTLTPEMVNAQFTQIDQIVPPQEKTHVDAFPLGNRMPATNIPVSTHGPVAREKREQELEHFITKKYNRLGAKIQAKINNLNSLITDPKIHLK
ncbi:hypothetical protein CHS0354_026034 [Potamilus streckersoni]|uniref:Cilia- and flagella-associated protein 221 n=1 Tax=Potamilus streckersoni TaxID=2493646 RepID=A0AAE0SCB5_9BIVA|nr:hypothetical protein CHS0354_026034 [Potamilus streckersoni]